MQRRNSIETFLSLLRNKCLVDKEEISLKQRALWSTGEILRHNKGIQLKRLLIARLSWLNLCHVVSNKTLFSQLKGLFPVCTNKSSPDPTDRASQYARERVKGAK